jgi:5-methylthioadenosine/S-adenosylhomocysteine deaminase
MSNEINRRNLLAATAALGSTAFVPSRLSAQTATDTLPARGEFVIRNAHVLSMDPAIGELLNGDVHVRNGKIISVGVNVAAPGARAISGKGTICMPGFVDTHWHLWASGCRQWYRSADPRFGYFPLSVRVAVAMTPEDSYRAVRFGLVQGLAAGVTTVHNWCHNTRGPAWADAEIQAMRDMGIRGRYSYGPPQAGSNDVTMDLTDLARVKREWFSDPAATDGRLTLGIDSRNVAPGQAFRGTITMDMAKRDWGGARELGLPITLHTGTKDLVFALEKEQLLGPDVQLVHPMLMVPEEHAILATRGTSFASAPLGETGRTPPEGIIMINELLAAKVPVSLSIDDTVNYTADFFEMMRVMYKYDRHRLGDKDNLLTTQRLVELATIDGAKALGIANQTGSLTPGKRADLITVRTTGLNATPIGDPWDALVLLGQPANIDLVVADGRIMRSDGRFTSIDQAKIERQSAESNARLAAFANGK